jgi:pantetheine-phosphate adenylyltransferase
MARTELAGIANLRVEKFNGLLVDYAQSVGARVIIRSIRTMSDFDYEFGMAMSNRAIAPEIETLFIMPGVQYVCINAQLVREIAAMGGPLEPFVSPRIAERLRRKKH